MRNLKRALSLVLASVMVLGLMIVGSSAASGSGFKDYDEVNYKEAADVLNALGIFIGDENGNFNPDQTLTRAMAAKIVATMLLGDDAEKLPANNNIFKDIDKSTETWAGGYIAYCANNGIIAGDGAGNFNPGGELTGVAFGKVLLVALGYNAEIEGYVNNPAWAIKVASAMVETKIDVDGVALNDPITREQAAQMALNTIKTPMVEYENSINVNVNGANITVGNSKATYKTTDLAKAQRISERQLSNSDLYTVEFGEKYMQNLVLTSGQPNEFGVPTSKWAYKTNDIGTYEREDLFAHEYTDTVKSKDLYGEIGYSRLTDYSLYVFVDGALVDCQLASDKTPGKNDFVQTDIKNTTKDGITRELLLKNSTTNLAETGKGVLTRVYVDDFEEEISVVIKNTYLAVAEGDFNETSKTLPVTIYTDLNADGTIETKTARLSSDDFANVAENKENDVLKVTMAVKDEKDWNVNGDADPYNDYDVISAEMAEIVPEVVLSGYSFVDPEDTAVKIRYQLSNVTADGTTYSANQKALYDPDVLRHYNETEDQLKNSTYNLYLDNYDNVLGLREVNKVDNYVFVTGYDWSDSILAQPIDTANIITTDGTMKTVSVKSSDLKTWNNTTYQYDKTGRLPERTNINTWYTYTIENDVYILQQEVRNQGRDLVVNNDNDKYDPDVCGTYAGLTTHNPYTEKGKNPVPAVYGNDNSVYIAVKADKSIATQDGSIVSVRSISTGIKNTNIVASDISGLPAFNYTDSYRTSDKQPSSADTFFIYNNDGYVTYAVVVGENVSTENNTVFFLSASVGRNYDASLGIYYNIYNVILKGEKTQIKVKDDEASAVNPLKYQLFTAYFDKNGIVTDLEGYTDDDEYYDNDRLNTPDNKADGYTQTTCEAVNVGVIMELIGNTLYVNNDTDRDSYVVIADGCKVFMKPYDSNTYSEYSTVRAALNSLTKESGYVARVTTIVNKITGYADTLIITEMKNGNEELVGMGIAPTKVDVNDDVKSWISDALKALDSNDADKLAAAKKTLEDKLADDTLNLTEDDKAALSDAISKINSALQNLPAKQFTVTLKDPFWADAKKVTVWKSGTQKATAGSDKTGDFGAVEHNRTYSGIPAGATVTIIYENDVNLSADLNDGTYKIGDAAVTVDKTSKRITFTMPESNVVLEGKTETTDKYIKVTLGTGVSVDPSYKDKVLAVGNDIFFKNGETINLVTSYKEAGMFSVDSSDTKTNSTATVTSVSDSDDGNYVYAGYKISYSGDIDAKVGNDTVTSGHYVEANTDISISLKEESEADAIITDALTSTENVAGTSMKLSAETNLYEAYKVTFSDANITKVTVADASGMAGAKEISTNAYVVANKYIKAEVTDGKDGLGVINPGNNKFVEDGSEFNKATGTQVTGTLNLVIGTKVTGADGCKVDFYSETAKDNIVILESTETGPVWVLPGLQIKIHDADGVKIGEKDADSSLNYDGIWMITVGLDAIEAQKN